MDTDLATYWNSNTRKFEAYPPIIYTIVRAMLDAQNSVLDGHVRKTTWKEVQDPRSGFYKMAVAAHKLSCPEFKLDGYRFE